MNPEISEFLTNCFSFILLSITSFTNLLYSVMVKYLDSMFDIFVSKYVFLTRFQDLIYQC